MLPSLLRNLYQLFHSNKTEADTKYSEILTHDLVDMDFLP